MTESAYGWETQQVICPTCGADAGQPCRAHKGGRPMSYSHQARRQFTGEPPLPSKPKEPTDD